MLETMTSEQDVANALREVLGDTASDLFAEALTEAVAGSMRSEGEDEAVAALEADNDGLFVTDVTSFRDAGVMTNNAGLVLSLSDGTQYQLTLVRSA